MESILNVHFSNQIKKKILQAALLQMLFTKPVFMDYIFFGYLDNTNTLGEDVVLTVRLPD